MRILVLMVNGWVRDNHLLDNDYYHELVGGEKDDPLEVWIDNAPPWLRFEENNTDLEDMPTRPAWRAFPLADIVPSETVEILMLNADVRIVSKAFLFLFSNCVPPKKI